MSEIFVFGSNLAGRHGAGSALHARQCYGAKYGQGEGLQGNSYAIPTKDGRNGANLRDPKQTLPLFEIKHYIDTFLLFAKNNPHKTFNVVKIGCSLAGYVPEQIAPMFKDYPQNVNLPPEFLNVLRHQSQQ